MGSTFSGRLFVAASKNEIPLHLFPLISKSLQSALESSSEFYIALSGGSLPSFLSTLPDYFQEQNIDPQWEKWHVVLADERLVHSTHADSNLKALRDCFLDKVPIPTSQIYGIDESLLNGEKIRHIKVAEEYQKRVFPQSDKREYLIDCCLLGFGPDGHTASLFPSHELMNEKSLLVAGIADSPKPPPERITLTMKVFDELSRNVIFVGAGESKAPILEDIFESNIRITKVFGGDKECVVQMKPLSKQQYPCGSIRPRKGGLYYITDASGAESLQYANQCCSL